MFSRSNPKHIVCITLLNCYNLNDTFSKLSIHFLSSIRSSIRLPPLFLLFEDCNAMVSLSQYIFSNVPLLNPRKEVVHYFWGVGMYILLSCHFLCHIFFSLIVETNIIVVIYEHSAPFSKIADCLLYFLCFFIILYTVDFEHSMQSTISFTDIPLSYRTR